ncbi:MAG: sugar ABC transporter permease [Chloroflexota bacterium]
MSADRVLAQPSSLAIERRTRWSFLGPDWKIGYALVLPVVSILLAFIAVPFLTSILMSFQDVRAGGDAVFVGLRNYSSLLFGANRARFFNSVWVSFLYTFAAIVLKFILGMTLALVLHSAIRGRNFFRALLFLPWSIPAVVSAYAWKWIYDDMRGVLNVQLSYYGLIKEPILWTADINLALWAVVAAAVWQGTPFWTMTFLAGLQSIPNELYDAAHIDGAGALQSFFYVTLPSLAGVILVTVLLSTIWTANSLQYVYILTAGGPANSTEVFPMLALNLGLRAYDLGMGATVPLVFFPFFAVLIVILTKRMLQHE